MDGMASTVLETPLVRRIREAVIGDDVELPGPFGPRRVVYADHTASGRSLAFIEDAIRSDVLPWYANTHTESSGTGRQTTQLREEARELILDAVGGGGEHTVIFTGSGSTGAIDKLLRILGLSVPSALADRVWAGEDRRRRPVVFVGPYEHHSNELLWRESVADVVPIDADATGRIDACWDYAAGGAHLEVAMRGAARRPLAFKDAVFLSPHKFPGGPGTPGVLVVRRELVRNRVPTVPGGAPSATSTRAPSTTSPTRPTARRAARPRSWSPSAPGWSSSSSRRWVRGS